MGVVFWLVGCVRCCFLWFCGWSGYRILAERFYCRSFWCLVVRLWMRISLEINSACVAMYWMVHGHLLLLYILIQFTTLTFRDNNSAHNYRWTYTVVYLSLLLWTSLLTGSYWLIGSRSKKTMLNPQSTGQNNVNLLCSVRIVAGIWCIQCAGQT